MTTRIRPFGPVETRLTTDQIDQLYNALANRRETTKTVSVSVEALTALLNDHAALCSVCKTSN